MTLCNILNRGISAKSIAVKIAGLDVSSCSAFTIIVFTDISGVCAVGTCSKFRSCIFSIFITIIIMPFAGSDITFQILRTALRSVIQITADQTFNSIITGRASGFDTYIVTCRSVGTARTVFRNTFYTGSTRIIVFFTYMSAVLYTYPSTYRSITGITAVVAFTFIRAA